MVRSFSVVMVAVALAAAGCERPGMSDADARQRAAEALPDMFAYPRSQIVSVSAGSEAAEVRLTTTAPPEAVAGWYRQHLLLNGWELRHEGRQPDGTAVIHATKQGRPLWITVGSNAGGPGTSYTLVGVAPAADSTS